jgi:type VI secretion system Hcp family effector
MPVYLGKSRVHGISLGSKAITPGDLKRMELSSDAYAVRSRVDTNSGQPSGRRQHAPNFNAFNCEAFSYSIESPVDVGTGQGSGKRQHSPLVIRKDVAAASPSFLHALAGNKVLHTLKLNFVKTNRQGTPQPYLTITLNGVSFAGYRRLRHKPPTKNLMEEISITYQEIEVCHSGWSSVPDDWATG